MGQLVAQQPAPCSAGAVVLAGGEEDVLPDRERPRPQGGGGNGRDLVVVHPYVGKIVAEQAPVLGLDLLW